MNEHELFTMLTGTLVKLLNTALPERLPPHGREAFLTALTAGAGELQAVITIRHGHAAELSVNLANARFPADMTTVFSLSAAPEARVTFTNSQRAQRQALQKIMKNIETLLTV